MQILLLANYIPDDQQSMNNFAALLETGLTRSGHQVRVIRPQPWLRRFKPSSLGVRVGKWLGYIDKYILFPQTICQELFWADIVHVCDHSNAIYTKYLKNIPHVVTCNDLIAIRSALGEFQESKTKWAGRQLQRMILKGINQAQRVACISEKTKLDLMRISSLQHSKISLIHMGLNNCYAPMSLSDSQRYLKSLKIPQNRNFFLHVGGNTWYKNRSGVLSIFNCLLQKHQTSDYYLVMVGQPFTAEMHQLVKKYNLSQRVIELVKIDDKNLRALYSAATALLFPSLQEGFGWPIVEAQACGCPVFTSNLAPMTDIAGEAAIYINPNHPEEAAEKIARSLPKLKSLTKEGIANARKFTLDKMINSYLDLYKLTIFERNKSSVC
ncbi:MAG: glycosyltransferase family 1 protein [Cyanobacteriota bacterium]|nr:glycosyltransferase family 1 protein [Cyanobacteriota bacterium]